MEEKEIIPVGWNIQRVAPTPNGTLACESCVMGETIPDGWNSKRESSNTQHDLGAIDMKVMIPGGWNSQREVINA